MQARGPWTVCEVGGALPTSGSRLARRAFENQQPDDVEITWTKPLRGTSRNDWDHRRTDEPHQDDAVSILCFFGLHDRSREGRFDRVSEYLFNCGMSKAIWYRCPRCGRNYCVFV